MPDLHPRLLALVSLGGTLGALTRYGLTVAVPHATVLINISGCFLIGVLMALAADRRLLRLFLGTGFLGGYTTFSTSAVDVQRTPFPAALVTLGVTLLGALLAVWAGTALASRWVGHR